MLLSEFQDSEIDFHLSFFSRDRDFFIHSSPYRIRALPTYRTGERAAYDPFCSHLRSHQVNSIHINSLLSKSDFLSFG